ncbi:hypothetical protein MNV84_01533 [Leishmania braziliensis]|nr:hypothetical protein MNV84_01533 [Leishmania braziliensis]
MDLDDIDRWYSGGSSRDHYRSRYAPHYSRKWNDTHQSIHDPPLPRRYFNDDPIPEKLPSHRSAPPPPPPPSPPPHRSNSANVKRKNKRHSKHRHTRRKRSASFTSSSAARTETSRTSSISSTDSAESSTTSSSSSSGSTASGSGSYESSDSERTSSTSASTSSTSASSTSTSSSSTASSHERRAQLHKKVKPHLQQSAVALSRVASRPYIAVQDEEIAAAAACKAIFNKEVQLKEEELRLLQQKRNFAAEVQRRSLHSHRFAVEDDAIRQMQRLVDLTDTTPALEEYLRRTSKALSASGATTDAGALAYLRSYEEALSGDGVAPLLKQMATPPSTSVAAAANARRDERLAVVGDGPPAPISLSSGTPKIEALAATRSIAAAAPTASGGVLPHRTSPEANSLLEHSLPVEGHFLTRSAPPTPTGRAMAQAPSQGAPVLSITTDAGNTENGVVVGGAPAEGVITVAKDERQGGSAAQATAKPAEPAVSRPLKGDLVIHNDLPQQRRIKVKARRRRSRSRALAHQGEADRNSALENAPSSNERREDSTVSPSVGHSQPGRQQQPIGASWQLLPPPPSPASHTVSEQQHIFVDPMQQYNSQSGAGQQPWAMVNWPCNAPTWRPTHKEKDGPLALWYTSNSPAPLSHRDFKSLLCSEYVSPETMPALVPRAVGATAASVDADNQVSAAPAGAKAGRNSHTPYSTGTADTATLSGETDAGEHAPRRSSRRRLVRIRGVDETPEYPLVAEWGHGEGDSQAHGPAEVLPPPPVDLRGNGNELIVEFPPPPHITASDMPPPGDVGSDVENSCCGCGGGECNCCSAFCARCRRCWYVVFSCLFPCCSGQTNPKAALPIESQRTLSSQRHDPDSALPVLSRPIPTTPATMNAQP